MTSGNHYESSAVTITVRLTTKQSLYTPLASISDLLRIN